MPRMVGRSISFSAHLPSGGAASQTRSSFNGVACPSVALERLSVHARQIELDPLGVFDHVGHAVGRIVLIPTGGLVDSYGFAGNWPEMAGTSPAMTGMERPRTRRLVLEGKTTVPIDVGPRALLLDRLGQEIHATAEEFRESPLQRSQTK